MERFLIRRYTKGAFPKRFHSDDIIEEHEVLKTALENSKNLNHDLCERQGYTRKPGDEPGYYVEELEPEVIAKERKPYPKIRASSIY